MLVRRGDGPRRPSLPACLLALGIGIVGEKKGNTYFVNDRTTAGKRYVLVRRW